MGNTLTLANALALLSAMIVLALLPSLSVLTVVARSVSLGFLHGIIASLGILIGDFIFILIAIYGLNATANRVESLFLAIQYGGGAYLIWLGINLCRAPATSISVKEKTTNSSWLASLLSGLTITLGDQKAIFFYISFFPAFLDLTRVTVSDTLIIMLITTVAVGGVKVVYAYLARRAQFLLQSQVGQRINLIAGCLMILAGITLFTKARVN